MDVLHFVVPLTVLSLAMVAAMVAFTKAWISGRTEARRWGLIYAVLWGLILGLCVSFAPHELRFIVLFAAVFFAVHGAILWLGRRLAALQPVPSEHRLNAVSSADIEDEDEEEEELPAEPEPPLIVKAGAVIFWLLRWVVTLVVVLLIIGVGELLPPLRRIDTALARYHPTLQVVLPSLVGLGFVLFMGGILSLVSNGRKGDGEVSLHEATRAWRDGTWRDTARMTRFFIITAGVVLMMAAGAAAGIVFAPPGIKLLILLVVGYVLARYLLARMRMAASM